VHERRGARCGADSRPSELSKLLYVTDELVQDAQFGLVRQVRPSLMERDPRNSRHDDAMTASVNVIRVEHLRDRDGRVLPDEVEIVYLLT
jgi:hypothetical protein